MLSVVATVKYELTFTNTSYTLVRYFLAVVEIYILEFFASRYKPSEASVSDVPTSRYVDGF